MKSLQTERFQCMSPKFSSPTKQLGNCPISHIRAVQAYKRQQVRAVRDDHELIFHLLNTSLGHSKTEKRWAPPGAVASHYLQMLPPLVSVVRRFFLTKILPTKEWKLPIFQLPNIWESGTLQPAIFHKFWMKFPQKKKHPTNKQNKTKQSKAKQSKAQQNKQTTNQPTKQTKQTNKKHLKTNPSQQKFLGPLFWGWMKNSIGSELNQPLRCWETLTWTTTGGHATLQTSGEGRKEGINDGWWIKPQVVQPELGNYTKQSSDVDDVASQIIRCFMMVVAGFTYPRTLLIGIRFPNNKFGKV